MTFTQDEINLMCIYDTSDKGQLQMELSRALPYIENAELREITETVIHKLERMTAAEFLSIEFVPIVTKEDVENE